MTVFMQPAASKVAYPFKTWSGIAFLAQLGIYGVISFIEFSLWATNTRDFIIFGQNIALWGTLIAFAVPWILHLVQMTAFSSTQWDTT